MNAGGARLNHGLHEFEGVEVAAESRFGVGNERSEPVRAVVAFGVMDLVGPHQGLIDAATQIRHAVGRIKTLVGVHLAGIVGVGGDLPISYIDGLQSSLNLLDGLVAGHSAESRDEGLCIVLQQVPQPLRAVAREGVPGVGGTSTWHYSTVFMAAGVGLGSDLQEELTTSQEFAEFLTLASYDLLD